MKRYEKQKRSRLRKQLNESSDCAVIALSIVCRTTYAKAHSALLCEGRKNRSATYIHQTLNAIVALGLTAEPINNPRQKNGSRFTPKTVGGKFKKGYYLCSVNTHIFALVNGDIEDWTRNRKHHITQMYKIVKKRK